MDKQTASKKIAEQLEIADKALAKAEKIADESGVSFSWSGPAYGMGGYYQPEEKKPEGSDEDWYSSDEAGWRASSQSC